MKHLNTVLSLLCFVMSISVLANDTPSIIPKPSSIEITNGSFKLNKTTTLFFEKSAVEFSSISDLLVSDINKETKLKLDLSKRQKGNCIIIQRDENIATEAYRLDISSDNIIITASTNGGVYYAMQTLKQLIPLQPDDNKNFVIPSLRINDSPSFEWRGYMLDVSRHFFDKDEIKEVLDFMGALKLNVFHWHLADDQGWRLEIDSYPKLNSVGSWRADRNSTDESVNDWWGRSEQRDGEKATYGGYYTKEEVREIIAYAKARNIEILPEIDVPGHSREILAAYPQASCDGGHYCVGTSGVNTDNALCASKPFTYQMLTAVLNEVMDLFPFEYIHIGGDECNTTAWENHQECQDFINKNKLEDEHGLQSYFIKEMEKVVNAGGKHLIGWNEILKGGLAPNATVMSWQGEKGGIEAARQGHKAIMTPYYANYFDMKQGQADFEPNLGYLETLLSTCYNFNVIPDSLTEEEGKLILGLQGNLWTESISDWGKLTYMTFPRLFAVAENGWTAKEDKDFEDFAERLQDQLKRLDMHQVRYAKSVYNVWIHQKGNGENIEVTLSSELPRAEIRYTLDGTEPKVSSTQYTDPFILTSTKTIKAAIFKEGLMQGDVHQICYPIHKASGAKVIYNTPPNGDVTINTKALTDLNYGQFLVQNDDSWQTFDQDMDVTIILDDVTDVEKLSITSLKKTIQQIYNPLAYEVYGSTDGKVFQKIGDTGVLTTTFVQGRNKITTDITCPLKGAVAIRVKAKIVKIIPEEHLKAGKESCMKIDEIMVF